MNDEIWCRAEPESPCINICVIHPAARLCTGCLRSINEITAWSRLSRAERARILSELPSRAGRLHRRRGGRAARISSSDPDPT